MDEEGVPKVFSKLPVRIVGDASKAFSGRNLENIAIASRISHYLPNGLNARTPLGSSVVDNRALAHSALVAFPGHEAKTIVLFLGWDNPVSAITIDADAVTSYMSVLDISTTYATKLANIDIVSICAVSGQRIFGLDIAGVIWEMIDASSINKAYTDYTGEDNQIRFLDIVSDYTGNKVYGVGVKYTSLENDTQGDVYLYKSTDFCKTWTEVKLLLSFLSSDDEVYDVGILCTSKGHVLVDIITSVVDENFDVLTSVDIHLVKSDGGLSDESLSLIEDSLDYYLTGTALRVATPNGDCYYSLAGWEDGQEKIVLYKLSIDSFGKLSSTSYDLDVDKLGFTGSYVSHIHDILYVSSTDILVNSIHVNPESDDCSVVRVNLKDKKYEEPVSIVSGDNIYLDKSLLLVTKPYSVLAVVGGLKLEMATSNDKGKTWQMEDSDLLPYSYIEAEEAKAKLTKEKAPPLWADTVHAGIRLDNPFRDLLL